jgi:hypothetical protein
VKRFAGITFSLIILTTYFLFATKGRIYTLFTMFFPKFHIILLLSVLFFGIVYFFLPKKDNKIDERLIKPLFFIIPFSVFAVSLFINRNFIVAPQPDDGIHYVWLSKLITNGRLFMELPEFYEHYHDKFILIREGKFVSIFLPGFSFFMAPFTALGIEFAFNPLIAGINTYLVGIHACALRNRTTGVLAMILFAFSSTHLIHGALYFPHHFGLMLVLISTYFIVNRPAGMKTMLIAGSILASSLFIRSQNAVYTYFAIAVFLVIKEKKLKPLLFFTIPFVVLGTALAGYNFYFTGDPFLFVQDIYFNYLDVTEYCHRPGFGKGCRYNQGEFLPEGGLNLEFAIGITFLRLNNFLHQISMHPLPLIFIVPAIIINHRKYFLYYFMPLCAVAAYFLFYIEGNYWGPRYFFESGALFLIASACGFNELCSLIKKHEGLKSKITVMTMNGIIMAAVINFSFLIFPGILFKHKDSDDLMKIKDIIRENRIENSIVMVPFSFNFSFSSILSIHDDPPYDRYGNLVLYSAVQLDENIQKYYKDSRFKNVYRIDRSEKEFVVRQIGFLENDGYSRVEFEGKHLPLSGSPKYVLMMHSGIPVDLFSFVPDEKYEISFFTLALLFDGRGDSHYQFEHSIKKEGGYKLEIKVINTKCSTGFDIEINGSKQTTYHPDEEGVYKHSFFSPLNSGRNTFKIIPHDKGCLILDYMDISKTQ